MSKRNNRVTPNPDNQSQPVRPESISGPAGTTPVYLRIGPAGRLPLYATAGSAGCDLYLARNVVLRPGEACVLPLDLVMALEDGVEAQIRPRSGLSLKTKLRLANSPGTIDSDYRHEVGVIMENSASLLGVLDDLPSHPELWQQLKTDYRQTTYAAYSGLDDLPPALADLPVFLDGQGNPYGTVYLSAGERVAQMVLARTVQAAFILHDQPETVGHDRGGGFGSTGRR